ncbi:uncharacterized protein LOC129598003 [Paramacrobiotus metropolitanus]|uniref:uncharacterized protein LOC129598003 n=1 Tax=Paramacrobiotus metropolitanus TaxID=2943436 RepID=UPI00244615D2|nr:uncharacterized protein LOC129598003 [Paramacrobiotus metropolitanus]
MTLHIMLKACHRAVFVFSFLTPLIAAVHPSSSDVPLSLLIALSPEPQKSNDLSLINENSQRRYGGRLISSDTIIPYSAIQEDESGEDKEGVSQGASATYPHMETINRESSPVLQVYSGQLPALGDTGQRLRELSMPVGKRAMEISLELSPIAENAGTPDAPEGSEGIVHTFALSRWSATLPKGHASKRNPEPVMNEDGNTESGLTLSITSPLEVLREKIRIDNQKFKLKQLSRKNKSNARFLKDLGR